MLLLSVVFMLYIEQDSMGINGIALPIETY